MLSRTMVRGSRLLAIAATAALGFGACNDTPTTAVVTNGFAVTTPVTVYKLWWLETLFPDALAPGAASVVQRTIPGSDFAYGLLAPGWSAADGPPQNLVAIKSAAKLTAYEHQLLRIIVADTTFTGDCAAGSALTADDASLITTQIFPAEFAGATYDPATCSTTVSPGAGGAAGADGAAGAPGEQGNSGGAGGGDPSGAGGAAGSGA